jgi:hypothetical protein
MFSSGPVISAPARERHSVRLQSRPPSAHAVPTAGNATGFGALFLTIGLRNFRRRVLS